MRLTVSLSGGLGETNPLLRATDGLRKLTQLGQTPCQMTACEHRRRARQSEMLARPLSVGEGQVGPEKRNGARIIADGSYRAAQAEVGHDAQVGITHLLGHRNGPRA